MGLYGAHDEVQVAGGDDLAVHLAQPVERLRAVAASVLEEGGLHFPVVEVVEVVEVGNL